MFKEDENPTKLCTYIYSHSFFFSFFFDSYLYMHCDKAIGNISKTNDECTSISCSKCSYCKKQPNEPIDNDRNI